MSVSLFSPAKKIIHSKKYQTAKEICIKLHERTFQAYFVGGCVRDFILFPDQIPQDIDIATDADIQTIQQLFPNCSLVGKSFGVCIVKYQNFSFEVATFRKDGVYLDRRHPSTVSAGTLLEDSQRRDFTINALYYSPINKEILDFHGGLKDIKSKLIRCVGNPNDRIYEDALRILRCLRFSVNFKFNIAPSLKQAIKKHSAGLKVIPMERILDEISKVWALFDFSHQIYTHLNVSLFSSGLQKKSRQYLRTVLVKFKSLNRFKFSNRSSFFEFFICLLQFFYVHNAKTLQNDLASLPCSVYDHKLCLWFLTLLQCDERSIDESNKTSKNNEFFKHLVSLERIEKSPHPKIFIILKNMMHNVSLKKIMTNYVKNHKLFNQKNIVDHLMNTQIPHNEYSTIILNEYFNFIMSTKNVIER